MKMAKNKKQNNAKAKAKNMNKVTDANANNNRVSDENNIGFENDTKNCK